MEWINAKSNMTVWIKKYRYLLAAVLVGVLLLIQPGETEPEAPIIEPAGETELELEESLAQILSHISGAGKVEVLLTQSRGEETLYQLDQDITESGKRLDTVLLNGQSREEVGLIRQINPPEYLGALVVCQGAESASVRLAMVEAVMSVTGLTSDRITVLKMK